MMNILKFGVGDVVILIIVWWVILFMFLPTRIQKADKRELGWDSGAPKKSEMKRKMLTTSFYAVIAWMIIHILVTTKWLSNLLGL